MLTDLESDLVERKESLSGGAPNRFRKAVCAFANDAIPVPTASIDDLSLRRFEEEYLPLAVDAPPSAKTIAASSNVSQP